MLASVRLSQVRNDEARAALEHSLQLWSNKDPGDPSIPIYDTRLALVKLLLEVQLYAEAFNVLEGLQKENDQSVDLWYLWGWSYYCLGDEQELPEEERKHHWEDARDCLETAIKVLFDRLYYLVLRTINCKRMGSSRSLRPPSSTLSHRTDVLTLPLL